MGADAGDFAISSNGELTFVSARNYEDPADADMDNTYMVTVEADDGTYMDTHDVTVMVTDVNEVETVTLSETRPEVGMEITAELSDDGDEILGVVTWQWASSDAMDGTYTDIEDATSDGYTPVAADATMYLRATAMYTDTHGSGKSAMAESGSMVVVGGLTISGMDSVEYAENGTGAVITYVASGPDADRATWTFDGDDVGAFAISTSGVLTFVSAPDYENPADADMDNTYMVTVEATDGTYMDSHEVTVMVTNVDELETVTLSATQPQIGMEITASLTGGDEISGVVMWQWAKAESKGATPTEIPGAMSAAYTPVEADGDMYLRATAMYTDAHGAGKSEEAVSENMVRGLAISGMMSVDYAENGTDAVATYMASGPDASMATWSLEGDDAGQFIITNGMLMFMTAPDFEMPMDADMDNTYMVTVKATGGTYMAMPLDVVVTVTDVDGEVIGGTLLETYDADDSGMIEKSEVITAINDYLFDETISRADVIAVINLYLFG